MTALRHSWGCVRQQLGMRAWMWRDDMGLMGRTCLNKGRFYHTAADCEGPDARLMSNARY